MKIFFLLFTLLFSASVLADCCNFEIESTVEQCSSIDHDQNDGCGDETQHTEAQHCHCSPINHFQIIPFNKILMTAPRSFQTETIPVSDSSLISNYESRIFHPPIA